ncbi:hypothetical protein MRB53_005992 [Persea americana]|uniref:Uncharacterized protein n=1 Tax=Persea americana TaxID=3435 RepID=A0ACC2MEX0_PERAE|nr:hypothetical protein MRB53_005992 [Persea americana]
MASALHLLVDFDASDTDPAPSGSDCSSSSTSCYVPTTTRSVLKAAAMISSPLQIPSYGISTPTEANCRP